MVSRQESARPLLTPGEVMQLPPQDALVMVSGMAPIRAHKLRYFEDRHFVARRLQEPELDRGTYQDRPTARSNDWSGQVRPSDKRLATELLEESPGEDEGGSELHRHPSLDVLTEKPQIASRPEIAAPDRNENDLEQDQRLLDRVRASLACGDALNQERGQDLLPGF
jgi:type IV secretion system protein VirD4